MDDTAIGCSFLLGLGMLIIGCGLTFGLQGIGFACIGIAVFLIATAIKASR